jgi:hypothetical protein
VDTDVVKASDEIRTKILPGSDGISIKVEGIPVDKIKFVGTFQWTKGKKESSDSIVGSIHQEQVTSDVWFTRLGEWLRSGEQMALKLVPEPYPTGESRMKALFHTATFRETKFSRALEFYPEAFKDALMGLDFLKIGCSSQSEETFPYERFSILKTAEGEIDPESWSAFENKQVRMALKLNMYTDAQFCVTEGGYIGIAPGGIAVGDVVVIVGGVTSPCFFRQCDGYKDISAPHPCYHHVGVGYIHGIIHDEKVKRVDKRCSFTLY